ncbi:MAG: aminopeptidase [Pseudomonadota bacterium]
MVEKTNGSETKKASELKENLCFDPARVWDKLTADEQSQVAAYADGYRDFLNTARTETKAVKEFVRRASEKGFEDLETGDANAKGFYQTIRGKLLVMAIPGRKPITEGARLIASHTDCPRLDLKQNPLYEDTDLAFLKTHYYGGIKKYHWVARPLALLGTIITAGEEPREIDVEIGTRPDDPVLLIPDLLPHLGKKQMEKAANEFITAEQLNVLIGNTPYPEKEAEPRVKLAILDLLQKRFGIKEEDFTSAELQLVPAESARDGGLDGSLIVGYGQDDRVCAYTSFTALMETEKPEYTSIAVFFDKEEIGSEGNTSAQSRSLEMFFMTLMEKLGVEPTLKALHRFYLNCRALSADVNAAFDPTFPDVFEKRNACRLGYGLTIEKYTGHGGKYMASDANVGYISWVRRLFNLNGIAWQIGGHGKVDEGGGGTVAKFLARTGMEVLDVGPAMLGMHSPMEVTAKDDVWMCHRGYKAFFAG